MKYRKLPVEIEAYQLPALEEDPDDFMQWAEEAGMMKIDFESGRDGTLIINTLEGNMTAMPGDYIIRGVHGEFYPCKPEIFHKTYEICT